jgi:hypothetical protein
VDRRTVAGYVLLSLVKFFSIDIDERLAHALQTLIALLQETGGSVGRIIISPVPIAEQRLKGYMIAVLALNDHPVQTGYLVIRKMTEYSAVQQLPCYIYQCICHKHLL